jgi:hypothetical protein
MMQDLNEPTFNRMAADWCELIAEETQRAHDAWETAFSRIKEKYDCLKKQGNWLGGPCDLLTVIGASRKELIHSAMIAWLLDPAGRHSLGSRFLGRLLRRCFPGKAFSNPHDAVPQCEVDCIAGRADIVVWGGQEFTLVIENKVDSWERPNQCDDYYNAFREEPGPLFVFLTPDGRAPVSATGRAKDAFQRLEYRELRFHLKEVLDETTGTPLAAGRAAAEQYLLTLTKKFA